ncbi:S8 family serine peptidase [Glycomyces niveus]|uniref:S8 family serine peptidase n=1 Tax=Glycomyces niveus TaxID=2820287 RepID=A0ABS3U4G7_9ACTN|nr:S8 family serine peptidase [Glycomyces sp. NEAU-S30]MBO3733665.1 S8 family serine peptidase [Glycomyces sp. NEAU-S30]
MAPADERGPCVPIEKDGESLNQWPWARTFIGLDQAQQYNRGTFETGSKEGAPVTIAVIDSGVDSRRAADVFGSRLLSGYDWWDENSKGQCDSSEDGHGTAVAAIAAGNRLGSNDDFVGVAPEANILPIRLFAGGDGGDEQKSRIVAKGIRDAVDHGADVVNVSSVMLATQELADAVAYATSKNVVIVAASGNDTKHMDDKNIEADKQTFYPANYPEVIAVGAHNMDGNWYAESNFGDNLDLLAPGHGLSYPFAAGEWQEGSGTSFAAPFVAGAAALLKGQFGAEATPAWIQQRLQQTAIHPPNEFNMYQGHGILNVAAALTAPVDEAAVTSPTVTDEVSEEPTQIPTTEDDREYVAWLDPDYDPLRTEKAIAWGSVGGSIVLVTLVMVLKKIVPKGRKRGWRPGTRKTDIVPAKAATE